MNNVCNTTTCLYKNLQLLHYFKPLIMLIYTQCNCHIQCTSTIPIVPMLNIVEENSFYSLFNMFIVLLQNGILLFYWKKNNGPLNNNVFYSLECVIDTFDTYISLWTHIFLVLRKFYVTNLTKKIFGQNKLKN